MPEPAETLARLKSLYAEYIAAVERLENDRKPGEGVFGLRGGPGDDPCHDRFAETLRAFYAEVSAQGLSEPEARELMRFACTAPLEHPRPRTAYWMLIAVQGLTQPLIALLSPEDAAALAELYEKSFRRRERLPVQTALIRALRDAAKQKP